jgi:hypothetical protein
MADFACWVVACEPALPWVEGGFLAAFAEARADVAQATIEADVVATAILALVPDGGEWTGTASALLDALNARRDRDARPVKGWPETPRAMGGRLRRAAPVLRAAGVEVEEERGTDRKRSRVLSLSRKHGSADDRPHRPHRPERTVEAGSAADDRVDGPARSSARSAANDAGSGRCGRCGRSVAYPCRPDGRERVRRVRGR